MGRARIFGALLAAAAAAAPWAAATVMTGGTYVVPNSGVTSGGGVTMSGGGVTATGGMGTAATTDMKGGGYDVKPGIVPSQNAAATDLSGAHAYPVPFIPSLGHTIITFSRLPAQVEIKVYTISGELVKTLVKASASTDTLQWTPVVNDKGQSVASGVYIWFMKSADGKTKLGKLMIIK